VFATPAETPKTEAPVPTAAEAGERSLDTSAFVTGSLAADSAPAQETEEISDEAAEYILTEPLRTHVRPVMEEVEEEPTPSPSPAYADLGGDDCAVPSNYIEEEDDEDVGAEEEDFQVLSDRGTAAQHRAVRVKNRSIEGDMLPDFNEVYDDAEDLEGHDHQGRVEHAGARGPVAMVQESENIDVERTEPPPYSYPPSGKDVAFI
jgi:hypothetical protein